MTNAIDVYVCEFEYVRCVCILAWKARQGKKKGGKNNIQNSNRIIFEPKNHWKSTLDIKWMPFPFVDCDDFQDFTSYSYVSACVCVVYAYEFEIRMLIAQLSAYTPIILYENI